LLSVATGDDDGLPLVDVVTVADGRLGDPTVDGADGFAHAANTRMPTIDAMATARPRWRPCARDRWSRL
jgi:hypothetical protein